MLYTLVQQVENNFLVPKIQGDAIELHPAMVIFAIVIGGALAGLLGAILALPIAAAVRDVSRYLFRRLSPDSPEALATSIHGLGLERHPGIPGLREASRIAGSTDALAPDPYKTLQVDSGGRGRGHRRGLPTAGAQVPPGRQRPDPRQRPG